MESSEGSGTVFVPVVLGGAIIPSPRCMSILFEGLTGVTDIDRHKLDVIEYRPFARIRNGFYPDLVSRCQSERTEAAPGGGVSVRNRRGKAVIGGPRA